MVLNIFKWDAYQNEPNIFINNSVENRDANLLQETFLCTLCVFPWRSAKPNANLFRTKSLLLRSGSINLLRNFLQIRHEKLFTFGVHNFENVISKHIIRSESERKMKTRCPLVFLSTHGASDRRTLNSQFFLLLELFMLRLLLLLKHISLREDWKNDN
jgi:hypothetical protein